MPIGWLLFQKNASTLYSSAHMSGLCAVTKILSYGNTSNKIAQLVSDRCETSWQAMLRVFPVEHNSSRDKENCSKLKNFVAESRRPLYFLQQSFSTCSNFFCRETSCARQEKRAALFVNLFHNDVPRRVELFCCSYYRSLTFNWKSSMLKYKYELLTAYVAKTKLDQARREVL